MSLKKEIINILEKNKYAEIIEIAKKERNIFRILISLTYKKEELICWKAIEATGIITGNMAGSNPAAVRNLAQKLLWMMRDESGNNPGSAPEMLGEIIRNSPDEFSDIAPVIASFNDEDMLRSGVLRALLRISDKRPDLISISVEFIGPYLKDKDPLIHIYSLLLAGRYRLRRLIPEIAMLKGDRSIAKIYNDGDFKFFNVGETAEKVYESLSGGVN